ncbi:MAG: AAA domain-containing protein [Candidatus Andersenbacteria bacterium]
MKKIEDVVSEALQLLISGDQISAKKLLGGVLGLEDIRASLVKFFEMFKVSDLFNDFHELYQNFKIEDKQEFYFYFYDISYQKNKYPIFYIPFAIERQSDTFRIAFDSQIYVNKKALAYIVQEYNVERNRTGALQTIADRIIYLADHENDLAYVLQETLTEITNFFDLSEKLQVAKPDVQTSKSLYVTSSTNAYIALFDKSDEALLNDYEDILNAVADSDLMKGFQVLINDFIHENPVSVAKPIRDDWDNKGVDERLVYKSPIPLNSEQQQILSAINNDRCKYVLVEGPPGTGKSHTITAIVFDTILKNKSVLVLSDKKEALDVVEKNIVNTLNKVRIDEKFQNPILRLGKTGNTYSQLLTQSSIEAITQQFRAVRSKYPNLNEQIDSAIEGLRNGVSNQTDAYQQILIADINELALLNKHFNNSAVCIDVDEAISNSDSVEELARIRSILLKLKNRIKENKDVVFNFDFTKEISEKNGKNFEKIISALEEMAQLTKENPSIFEGDRVFLLNNVIQKNQVKIESLLFFLSSESDLVNTFSKKEEYLSLLHVDKKELDSLSITKTIAQQALLLGSILEKVRYFAKDSLGLLSSFNKADTNDVSSLKSYIKTAKTLKSNLFGYIGKKNDVEELNKGFRKNFPFSKFDHPHKNLKELEVILSVYEYILELDGNFHGIDFVFLVTSLIRNPEFFFTPDQLNKIRELSVATAKLEIIILDISNSDFSVATFRDLNDIMIISEIRTLYEELNELMTKETTLIGANIDLKKIENINTLLQGENLQEVIEELYVCKEYVDALIEVNDDVAYLNESSDDHKNSFIKAGINHGSFSSLYENKLTEISDLEFEKLLRFITLHQGLAEKFDQVKDLGYGERMKKIENIVTMQMTYLMDNRFIDFTETYAADARDLKKIIKEKRKFPKDQFSKLKNAFPCILAGIRDYAEYIPLEPEIFDLVIIDEASQVSIAQAFPALLRAKKVVVLGDSLQFSNVKSALARGDINKQYLRNLREVFLKTVATEEDTGKIARLENFDIKVSVLDFFEYIKNYKARLVKHFRGYRELISYSNKFFYENSLQVMKVRGLPISSVIKFSQIEHDGKEELIKNTNIPEIEFIISELKNLKEQGKKCTVGIITPHTNQQGEIFKKISDLPESDYFFDDLKLKVMTFDTCQGEEMDIIYYSMVATQADDKLNYIFISNLNNKGEDDDEGKIKAQRLNVGLSRAKECMHFVLSKPIDEYRGTAKEFLQHYSNTLLEAQKEPDSTSVDKNSKMEALVLEWLKQTKFWDENRNNAEILPQFELGKYLKQLDRSYNHPNYRVDFLLVYRDEEGVEHKIIIEYDGFLEHFGEFIDVVNGSNYEEYYSPEDVYRQHVLEGYGYRFIRINKFNLGNNPIATLDSRIQEIVKKKFMTT